MTTDDVYLHCNYVTDKFYGRFNKIKLNQQVFKENVKSSCYLAQINTLRDSIILIDYFQKVNNVEEYLKESDYHMSQYFDILFSSECLYKYKDDKDKELVFHINKIVNDAYGQALSKKLLKTTFWHSLFNIYVLANVYTWEHLVYDVLDKFKCEKEFDWDLFKGDLQILLLKMWNLLRKTKTSFSYLNEVTIEDLVDDGVDGIVKKNTGLVTLQKAS